MKKSQNFKYVLAGVVVVAVLFAIIILFKSHQKEDVLNYPKESLDVLKTYHSYRNYTGLIEYSESLTNQIPYSDGFLKQYFENELYLNDQALELRQEASSTINLLEKYKAVNSSSLQQVRDYFNRFDAVEDKVYNISYNIVEQSGNTIKIKADYNLDRKHSWRGDENLSVEIVYILKKVAGKWKLIDWIDEDGLMSKNYSISNRKKEYLASITSLRNSILTIQNSIDEYEKSLKEIDANMATCPSGQKVLDWFECQEVKSMLAKNKDNSKLDCSKQENNQAEKILFEIIYHCEHEIDGKKYIGSTDYCEQLKGVIKPSIQTEAYPSLNEYYFNSISTEFTNIGCTKLNVSDFFVAYGLYQNNQVITQKLNNLYATYFYLGEDNEILYPDKYIFSYFSFGEGYGGTKIQRSDPNNYTFKICLISKTSKNIVVCDQANFNIEYEN